ncbi:MAG: AAA family ATPase [Pseudolabrys sp.]|nr:AAA family ATPase [Pseudolabrys sp.]
MLSGFSAENYRGFLDLSEVDLRPLTLLFGYNSSGKSALLQLLPLIRDSILLSKQCPLAIQSTAVRGGSFADLKSKFTSSPVLSIGLKWDDELVHSARYEIRDLPEFRTQVIERISIINRRTGDVVSALWVPGLPIDDFVSARYQLLLNGRSSEHDLDLRFRGLVPEIVSQRTPSVVSVCFEALAEILQRTAESLHWLQALRVPPPRHEVFSGGANRIEADGTGVTQLLAYDEITGGRVLNDVSQWFEEATRHRLNIRKGSFAGKELFSCVLSPSDGPAVEMEIMDTGEGMGQMLPVVGLLLLAKHGQLGSHPILSFEHPELHLHPSAHSDLARLFCRVAAGSVPLKMLVETHSENFLLAVQLAIVKKELAPDAVVVYWVRQSTQGTSIVDRVEFDELGRPKGDAWPPDVFAEANEQARELVLSRDAQS